MPNVYDGTTGQQIVRSGFTVPAGDSVAASTAAFEGIGVVNGGGTLDRLRGPGGADASLVGRAWTSLGTPRMTALNAVVANQNGVGINMSVAHNNWTFQVNTTGSPTGYSVQYQGSLDNANWTNLGAAITNAAPGNITVTNSPYLFIRANLTGLAGGSSPTITALFVGY